MCAVCWHSLWRASWLGPVMCALTATLPSAELVGLCHVVGALQASGGNFAFIERAHERDCALIANCPFASTRTET